MRSKTPSNSVRRALALFLASGLAAAAAGGTNVFDLAADFSVARNPNGPWTYGLVDQNGVFQTFTNSGPIFISGSMPGAPFPSGWGSGSSLLPYIGVYAATPGALACSVGGYLQNSVRERFTLPAGAGGTYQLTLAATVNSPSPVPLSVSKNNQLVWSVAPGGGATFSTNVALAAGDTLDFTEGYATIEATLSQTGPPPAITAQPQNQNVPLGGAAAFSVTATGAPPLVYQWAFGTNTIVGATNSTLNLTNVQLAQAGNYSVVVGGPGGSVTSSNALLRLASGAGTNVFDLAADFSTNSNPNGPWAYGGYALVGDDFYVFTNYSRGMWNDSTSIGISAGARAGTVACYDYTEILTFPYNAPVILAERFIAPQGSDGTYGLSLSIYDRSSLYLDQVSASLNGQPIAEFSPSTLDPTNYSYAAYITIKAGDVLLFEQEEGDYMFPPPLSLEATLSQAAASPAITAQPQNQTVALGGSVAFSVTATGAPPLVYQWAFGANAIVGATNSTLSLTNVQFAQAGIYSVAVSGPGGGSVISSNASLVVLAPGGTNIFDLAASFSASQNPNGPWTYGGQDANGNFYTFAGFETVNAYSGTASYPVNGWFFNPGSAGGGQDLIGSAAGLPGILWCASGNPLPGSSVPVRVDERFTLPPGADGVYLVTIAARPLPGGVPPLAELTVSKNGAQILSVLDDTGGATNTINVTLAAGDTVDFTQATPLSPGVLFEAALYQPNALPSISTQPQGQTVVLGGPASFSVTATAPFPLAYQWMTGPNAIVGATNSALILSNVQYAQAGNYSVVVSGPGGGSVTSSNALLTVLTPTSPGIAAQPGAQTLAVGASATLSVTATGSPPFRYQWYVGASGDTASPVAGATNAVFTTAQLYSSVSFWVAVQNAFGSAKSASALVTVVPENAVSLGVQLTAGFPTLTIVGSAGTLYYLEYKTDLRATNWSPLLDVQLPSNSYTFTDAGFTNSARFYRVRSAP